MVLAVSAEIVANRPVVVRTSVELLESAYSVTATLSAAASQARLIVVVVLPVARRFDGALGGSVSLASVVGGTIDLGGVGVGDTVGGGGGVGVGGRVGVVAGGTPATSHGR